MDTRTCSKCQETKDIDLFARDSCKTCAAKYMKAYWDAHPKQKKKHLQLVDRNKKRKKAKGDVLIQRLKAAPCMDCKISYIPYVMDFDHVRGIKVKNVSLMRYFSEPAILSEIAKCDLVCANCHRIRTFNRMQGH